MQAVRTLRVIWIVLWNITKALLMWLTPSFLKQRKNISGQLALVTGGGNGLGRFISLRLAELGADVVIWDVDVQASEVTRKMILDKGQRAYVYFCDISDGDEVYRTAQRVKKEVGKVDILVNNAGVGLGKTFDEASDEEVQKLYGINILSHYWTCRAFLPDMIQDNKGHVVAVSSLAGMTCGPYMTSYSPTKHAVLAFMECLQMELIFKGTGEVYTTTACPGLMNTTMFTLDPNTDFKPPLLDAKNAARDILHAMLLNQEVIVVPAYASLLLVLTRTVLKGRVAMNTFVQCGLRGSARFPFIGNGVSRVADCKVQYRSGSGALGRDLVE